MATIHLITQCSTLRVAQVPSLVVLLSMSSIAVCFAGDWPAFRGDADHTGIAQDRLQLPLNLAWQYQPAHPPQPAFRGGLAPSKNRVESITYDYVFEPIVTEGRLFFASSSEDAVFCLDSLTGAPLWTFYAEGPVRFAPRVSGNRLYFGSDNGQVYCLDVRDGAWSGNCGPRRPISAASATAD